MKPKFILAKLIFCLLPLVAMDAVAQNVKTKIKDITVYRNGAMVTRKGSLNLQKGNNTLYLNGLSTELDPNTLRIGISNKNVKILSVKHEETVIENDKAQKFSTSSNNRLALLKDSLTYCKAQIDIISKEEALIKANKNIGGENNGVTTAELKAMTDFYKKELAANASKKISVNRKIKKYRDEILRLTQEKENHHKSIQKKDSRVKLVLSSPSALTDVAVTLNYIVFSASWEPFYELRADAANEPIKLVYGAHIKQSTTEDWNGVKLTISTGDPSLGNSAPDFKPMYLPGSKESKEEKKWTPPVSKLIYGTVVDKNQEPIAGARVVENDADNKTTTDSKGRFVIELEKLEHSLSFAHAGFYSDEMRAYENMHVILQENKDALNENYVDYGVNKKACITGSVVKVNSEKKATKAKGPKEIKYNENIPLKLSDTQTTTEFDIKVPYTIPGDGKVYDVSMLTYDIDVDYHYSTMPRASKNVYLLADLKNFSQYPLLRGNAYVYLDNIYQGECVIAPDFSADTFSVPVGKDKDIAVSRQEVKDLTSKKILGSSIKVVKCVEITVKNNKNAEVEVEVCDQYPLPKYSDIKSEVTDKGGAEIDAEKGKLTWKLKLAPQEKKVLRFSYEVKYPKTYGFTVE